MFRYTRQNLGFECVTYLERNIGWYHVKTSAHAFECTSSFIVSSGFSKYMCNRHLFNNALLSRIIAQDGHVGRVRATGQTWFNGV